jgi:tetratricopeptide (TPR) repeat protein
MKGIRLTLSVLLILCSAGKAFCQSEVIKPVINNLAFYKQKKDLKYLTAAKKSIDSLFTTKADSVDLQKVVYRAVVNISIVFIDSLNTLKQPETLFPQTVAWVDKISKFKRIDRFQDQMDYVNHCIANVYIRQGFKYMATSDFVNAQQSFISAQKYAPNFKQLNFYIAYSNNKLGNLHDAAKYYNNLIKSDSTKSEYFETAANIYKSTGDTAKALELLKRGRKLMPDDKSLLLDEANIYNNRGNYTSLEPLLGPLLDIYPNNADIAFVAANCYDHLGNYNKAEKLYLQAIDLNGSAYNPVFNLGLLYFKESLLRKNQNDTMLAEQMLKKANDILPNDVNGLKVLQLIYIQTQNKNQLDKVDSKLKQLTNQ